MPIEKDSGFILINKPSGITSHDVVNYLRRVTGLKKIGHAGTLDPLASGLLICAIGRESTRQIDSFAKMDKVYRAEVTLGAVSDTYDSQGVICVRADAQESSLEQVQIALKKFIGEQLQVPPMYSAKKVKGQKLYDLARQGIEIERQPCQINISRLELISYQWPKLSMTVACSTGTYIRSLIYDLGEELKTGAYMSALVRESIGVWSLSQAHELKDVNKDNWKGLLLELEELKR